MPLSFITKLAGKLLGKPVAAKTSATKADHAKKSPHPPAARAHGAPPAKTAGEARPPSDERQRGPRRERPAGTRGPRPRTDGESRDNSRRPRRDDRRDDRRDGRRGGDGAVAPVAAGAGRPVARPPSRQRHERGMGEERPVSNPNARRPGGAVADEEQAKRRAEHATWSVDQYQVEPAEGKKRFQDFDLPTELLMRWPTWASSTARRFRRRASNTRWPART